MRKKVIIVIAVLVTLFIAPEVLAGPRCYQAVEKLSDYGRCVVPRATGLDPHHRQIVPVLQRSNPIPPHSIPIVPHADYPSNLALTSFLVKGYPRYLAYPYYWNLYR